MTLSTDLAKVLGYLQIVKREPDSRYGVEGAVDSTGYAFPLPDDRINSGAMNSCFFSGSDKSCLINRIHRIGFRLFAPPGHYNKRPNEQK